MTEKMEDVAHASKPIEQEKNIVTEQAKGMQAEISPMEKAYKEMKDDMHKFKSQYKTAEAELNKIKAEGVAREKAQLESNEEYKQLYELEKQEKQSALNELQEKSNKFIDSSKINAVVQEIGGFKKSDYNKFINPQNVELDESGVVNKDSLQREVDRIKQNFPELLKQAQASKMPSNAPTAPVNAGEKSVKGMSGNELRALLKDKFNKQ